MLERIYARVMKWLARHGLLRNPGDVDASNAPPELSSAEALTTAGMQRGTLVTVRESGDSAGEDDPAIAPPPPPRVRLCRDARALQPPRQRPPRRPR